MDNQPTAPAVAVVPSSDVQGNITACQINQQLLSIQRQSAFSITELDTYITYDVCSKKVLAQYSVHDLTDFGTGFLTIGAFILLFAAFTALLTLATN
jgi:hypothetical protein